MKQKYIEDMEPFAGNSIGTNFDEDNVTYHTCTGASDETMYVSRDMDQLLECSMEYTNYKGSSDTDDERLESDFF